MRDSKFNKKGQELVINWHLTEACNYRCQYCYAKWNKASRPRELIHDSRSSSMMLAELYQFFRPHNKANPLAHSMTWSSVRLNLAGGEPLLYPQRFLSVMKQARNLGFEVSLITNASQLDRAMLNLLAPQLAWLGISLDSQEQETNKAIGRITKNGHILNIDRLIQDIQATRQRFPGLRLKVNTVVNLLNHEENLGVLISRLSPDKWKVLQMLPLVDERLSISSAQFAAFISRHKDLSKILFPEDNLDMCESYLMIDPHGRFFQNSQGSLKDGYFYSPNILEVGAESAFSEMAFDIERFSMRYRKHLKGEAT